ncbi:MAG: TIGR00300 family protein [Chloroflexi bacterium]|nr:TIGR00300 family protein [Chloroflexota bacterium]
MELRGHLIDSLILPKVLDEVMALGGSFALQEVRIGRRREEPSYARIEVEAPDRPTLDRILARIKLHGAEVMDEGDAALSPAPAGGVFPEGFYICTGQPTLVRLGGQWVEVGASREGCAITVDRASGRPSPVPFGQVSLGDLIVTGHGGVRVRPPSRSAGAPHPLELAASPLRSEMSREVIVQAIAQEMRALRQSGGRTMLVAGEVVATTGGSRHVVQLVELGYVQLLFAGNDLALHDAAQAIYGSARPEDRLRAANAIRAVGGLRSAVESGLLAQGMLHTCLRSGVDLLLAGSVRDEGFLPEAITDAQQAQRALAEKAQGVSLALMVATGLYSLAAARLLPAPAWAICADINPAVVARLGQRGPYRTVGLVTDAEPFLHMLLGYLE